MKQWNNILSFVEISEMDTNIEKISSGVTIRMSIPRKSRYLSTATESKISAQTVAMDLRLLRQIILCGKTSRCSFR